MMGVHAAPAGDKVATVEVTQENFNQVVNGNSMVIVDFWAPWCAPCRALGPVLEKLESEYQGRFTLAKVNSDDNPDLATQYGVRGIPNVKAFVRGTVVDEFSGALPERAVREFLDRVIPSPAEERAAEAEALYRESGDGAKALALLDEALEKEPGSARVLFTAARILTDLNRFDEAKALIEKLPAVAQMDDAVAALRARIDFAAAAAAAPGAEELQQRIARDSGDLEARLALANVHAAKEDYPAALEELLEIVRRDRAFRDDIARKTMLQIFNVLGSRSDIVSEYRRRLSSAMY